MMFQPEIRIVTRDRARQIVASRGPMGELKGMAYQEVSYVHTVWQQLSEGSTWLDALLYIAEIGERP